MKNYIKIFEDFELDDVFSKGDEYLSDELTIDKMLEVLKYVGEEIGMTPQLYIPESWRGLTSVATGGYSGDDVEKYANLQIIGAPWSLNYYIGFRPDSKEFVVETVNNDILLKFPYTGNGYIQSIIDGLDFLEFRNTDKIKEKLEKVFISQ